MPIAEEIRLLKEKIAVLQEELRVLEACEKEEQAQI